MKIFVAAPILFFLTAAPAWATSGWQVDLGFGAVVPPASWVPLRITAPTAGAWTLEIRRIPGKGEAPSTFNYPGGGSFERPLFLGEGLDAVELRILEGGWVRQQIRIPVADRRFPGQVVLVDGLGPADQSAIEAVLLPGEPVLATPLSPTAWPASPLSWGGIAAAAVRDPGPVLSPAQGTAVRAWLASGGRLVLVGPLAGEASLASQLGPAAGLGRLVTLVHPSAAEWKAALDLAPFGQVRRLGTDFGPAPTLSPPLASAEAPRLSPWAGGVLAAWALACVLFAQRKKAAWGPALGLGLVVSALLFVLGPGPWDGGLVLHSREVVLPGNLGRIVHLEVTAPAVTEETVGWPQTSPWAVGTWKRAHGGQTDDLRFDGSRLLVREAFLPPVVRPALARVKWTTGGLRWSTGDPPLALAADLPWITRVVATAPGVPWSVGTDPGVWVEPVGEASP